MTIRIKKSHKGLLHKDTGTPKGKKVPLSKIKAQEHSKSKAKRLRAQFADNSRKFNNRKGGRKS